MILQCGCLKVFQLRQSYFFAVACGQRCSHHFFKINRLHKKHSLAHATVVHQHPLHSMVNIHKQQRSHKSRRGSRPRHSCSTCTSLCRMLSDSALRFWWACCLRTSPSTNTSWKAGSPSKDGKSKENGWDMVRYKTVHPFLHASSNEVFSPNSSNMYIIEKIMGRFHRREPAKVHFIYHIIWTGA